MAWISLEVKTKIAIWVVGMLLTGMVLLDLVVVMATQQILVRAEKSKGRLLIAGMGAFMNRRPASLSRDKAFFEPINRMLESNHVLAALWTDDGGDVQWQYPSDPQLIKQLRYLVSLAVRHEKEQIAFFDSTWGVFWKQPKYVLMVSPGIQTGSASRYAAVALSLDSIHKQLREAQKLVGIYLLINICLLSFIAFYRIYALAIRPIAKMTDLAESYRPEDGVFLLDESDENEFLKLSRSINRILELNQEDQQTLKQTVEQLESALQELKQAQQKIIRSEKLATVGRLSAGIAHEIGNPIGIVLGYLALLKEQRIADSDRCDYVERAEAEVNRIRIIIRQLLDYATPSEGSSDLVSVHQIINELVQMARLQPLFQKISVTAELEAEFDHILGDPNKIRQLFLNFMVNAADAIDAEKKTVRGCFRIKSENKGLPDGRLGVDIRQMITISFEDNGQGIAPKDLEKIFDPFYTTKPAGKGSGLGLWVSLLIAESMGGKISVNSACGKGTVMTLYLPVADNL